MNYLYHAGDYRGFYIIAALSRPTHRMNRRMPNGLSRRELRTAAKEEWAGVTSKLAEAVANYKHRRNRG